MYAAELRFANLFFLFCAKNIFSIQKSYESKTKLVKGAEAMALENAVRCDLLA